MREFVKWEKQYHYPHMRDFEIELIEKYIEKFPDAYDRVAYSYPVGHGAPSNPIVNDETGGSDEYLYFKKIDMLCKKGNTTEIIEVKKKAGASAIGQVKGYKDLLELDEVNTKVSQCVILTNETNSDLEIMAQKAGVKIIVV